MIADGAHLSYVVLAYGIGLALTVAVLLWTVLDARRTRAKLRALDPKPQEEPGA